MNPSIIVVRSRYPWLSYKRAGAVALGAILLGLAALAPSAVARSDSAGVTEQVSSAASDAERAAKEAGQAALREIDKVWQKISERRLANRTPDELVAWVIMGLLAGGLASIFSRFGGTTLGRLANFVLGLIGAFVGGILAGLTQLNLGLGPILIRYEELLLSFVGALLILLLVRLLTAKSKKEKS